jgi:hypothetical protein
MKTAADVDEVFDKIRAQAGSMFAYSAMDMTVDMRVTLADHSHVEAKKMKLTEMLQQMIDKLNARREPAAGMHGGNARQECRAAVTTAPQ